MEQFTDTVVYNSVGVRIRAAHFGNSSDELIVFYSQNKIVSNFIKFINIYYPNLNKPDNNNNIEYLIKYYLSTDYGVTSFETINGLTEKLTLSDNWLVSFFFTLQPLLDTITVTLNDINKIITAGLGIYTINNVSNDQNEIKSYYLNDYNTEKDFIIYTVPTDFNQSNINAQNENINDIYDENYNTTGNNIPYKWSLNRYIKYTAKQILIETPTIPTKPITEKDITEEDITEWIKLIKSKIDVITDYIRLCIIGHFIKLSTNRDIIDATTYASDLQAAYNRINTKQISKELDNYLATINKIKNN